MAEISKELFAQRFNDCLEKKQVSLVQMSKLLGVSYEMCRRYSSGLAMPSWDTVEKMAVIFSVKPMWLFMGEQAGEGAQDAKKIPLLDVAVLLRGKLTAVELGKAPQMLSSRTDLSEKAFGLRLDNNSMESRESVRSFSAGDITIFDPELQPEPGDFVLAEELDAKGNAKALLFRKFRPTGKGFTLVALNPDYPERDSKDTKLRVIGTMVEHRIERAGPRKSK